MRGWRVNLYFFYKKTCLTSLFHKTNLFPKQKYICHIRNLQFYLREGVQLKAIYRALAFKQEAWIKPYIMYNTEKRQAAQTKFTKAFHKLLNNAFFGKTYSKIDALLSTCWIFN